MIMDLPERFFIGNAEQKNDAFVEDGYGIGTGKRVYSSFDNFKNNSIIVNEMFEDISIIDF